MVASADRLPDDSLARGIKTSKQHAAFDLSAGDWQRVVDAVKRRAMNSQRCEFFISGFDAPAHFGKWLDDAEHGTSDQRFIAGDGRVEGLTGENTGEQANGGTRITGVEDLDGRGETVDALAMNSEDLAALALGEGVIDAKGFHTGKRGMTVCACGVVVDFGVALGDCGEHGVAM